MATVRIQGENERNRGIYYEYDPADTPLGEGGMGKVYKGWCCNESTNQRREVAIKFLYSDLPQHVISRARREAAVQLKNESLIEMLGFVEIAGRDELGQQVIRYHVISEYLHGVTLDKLLNGVVTDNKGNVIPFAQELYGKFLNNPYNFAITIVRNLLSGLMALHDAGYIHRDIDPSNIMITSNGKIKLIDFGIAKKISGNNTKESTYTVDGQFIGKPKYAAPELVRGLVDSQNSTTDLYAVGILLYQLLIGKVPFEGEMAEVLEMQLSKKMPLHNIKQKQIREVINTATQKKRSNRYQSAAEFRVAIDKLMPLEYPGRTVDWKKIGSISVCAALFSGIIVCAINIVNNKTEQDKTETENTALVQKDKETPKQINPLEKYDEAVKMLSNKDTAAEGLEILKNLADNNNYKATFLLSRLYFNGEGDRIANFSDSIDLYKANLGIQAHNKIAHKLLKDAVNINPNDYHSLFELGCDYKSNFRGTQRQEDSAYFYFNKAKQLAIAADDKEYIRVISSRMGNVHK